MEHFVKNCVSNFRLCVIISVLSVVSICIVWIDLSEMKSYGYTHTSQNRDRSGAWRVFMTSLERKVADEKSHVEESIEDVIPEIMKPQVEKDLGLESRVSELFISRDEGSNDAILSREQDFERGLALMIESYAEQASISDVLSTASDRYQSSLEDGTDEKERFFNRKIKQANNFAKEEGRLSGNEIDDRRTRGSDCCDERGGELPACEILECADLVCYQDPFCCEERWERRCAEIARSNCEVCQVTEKVEAEPAEVEDVKDAEDPKVVEMEP